MALTVGSYVWAAQAHAVDVAAVVGATAVNYRRGLCDERRANVGLGVALEYLRQPSGPVNTAWVNSSLTAKDIQGVRFSKSSRGYSPVAVDSFLLRVEARLQGRAALSAAEVRNLVFRRPSLSGWGYDQDEVNNLKEQIASALAELEAHG